MHWALLKVAPKDYLLALPSVRLWGSPSAGSKVFDWEQKSVGNLVLLLVFQLVDLLAGLWDLP